MNLTSLSPLLVALLSAAPTPPTKPAAAPVADLKPLPGLPQMLTSGVPEVPPALRKRVGQYLEARTAAFLDASDDGRQVLISTRFGDTNQLHVVASPMGARTQLTFGSEPITQARFQPGNPGVLYYLQDVGGGEFFQVFRFERSSGRSQLLTDGKSRHEALLLSEDGKQLAYAGTGRNGKDTDVYVAPTSAAPAAARRVTELEGTWYPVEFSQDGTKLLVTRYRAADDGELHVVDLRTGARTQLTPREGKGSVNGAAFSADGKTVYLLTDRYSDFTELYRIPLAEAAPDAAAAPRSLTRSVRWNVEDLVRSPDGRKLALHVNEDGYSRLYLLDTKTEALSRVAIPEGVMGRLDFPRGRSDLLTYALTSPREPSDVYQVDLRTGRGTRWTQSEVGGLDPRTFSQPELVRYPSSDGVKVPALLYKPQGAKGALPTVVVFHGGPEGQSQPAFSSFIQLLATELKVAVLVPNVRGSEGYGKAYRAMDDGVKREQSLQDIGATLDFIRARPELDEARVGVYGGSYGGYMVLASAAFYPERIRAAVDVVGVSSLASFLENTQAYRRELRRAEYGDERVPEVRRVQERISPLNAVERMQAALYVQQGANDPRVPRSEAEQIVQAVRAKGRDVWYALAMDEGHGFQKKPNRDLATITTLMFLEKHLAPANAAPVAPGK
jgi:dipeptidyl aminopeptidase/acylaminoacyl peptidase